MSIPRWNRVACTTCNGSGRNPKKRKETCPKCNGSGQSNICADCGKEITGAGNFENSDIRCICQDIPFGAI
ncbi:MAG: hypothetical protein PHF86_02710 [Candidatus Nanoarchaeia archaeon]|jgi:DnaJ-class molecular chaperone|nr:hypothetical protein [Candidatus Nanoarchaeia archaeon]